jgi:hypothetical protein
VVVAETLLLMLSQLMRPPGRLLLPYHLASQLLWKLAQLLRS